MAGHQHHHIDPIAGDVRVLGYCCQPWVECGSDCCILMLGSPEGIDVSLVQERLVEIEGVESIHHIHLWQMQEHEAALDAHLVTAEGQWKQADASRSPHPA